MRLLVVVFGSHCFLLPSVMNRQPQHTQGSWEKLFQYFIWFPQYWDCDCCAMNTHTHTHTHTKHAASSHLLLYRRAGFKVVASQWEQTQSGCALCRPPTTNSLSDTFCFTSTAWCLLILPACFPVSLKCFQTH